MLFRNVASLYGRTIITTLIALYATRLLLQALGVVDFGVFRVVYGISTIFCFITTSMAVTVQRFFAVELGKGSLAGLKRVFNAALVIHIGVALAVLLLAETIGLYLVKTRISVAATSPTALFWLYQTLVGSVLLYIMRIPFTALLVAQERIRIIAAVEVVDSVLKLALTFLLFLFDTDRLPLYGLFYMLCGVVVLIIYMSAKRPFTHQRIELQTPHRNSLYHNLISFSGWSMLWEMALNISNQGVEILLNIFCGPVANASAGIAAYVKSLFMNLTRNVELPFSPRLIRNYTERQYGPCMTLYYRGTLIAVYLLLLVAIPLCFNMEAILALWLAEVPESAALFCRLIVIGVVIDAMGIFADVMVKATGKIRNFQIVTSLILLLNFPISYIALKQGAPSSSVYVVYIIVAVMVLAARIFMASRKLEMPIPGYLRRVVLPIILVLLITLPFPIFINYLGFGDNLLKILCKISFSSVIFVGTVYFVGLDKETRSLITDRFKR
jgi:O-antigen/teichoic acid export membrane protein